MPRDPVADSASSLLSVETALARILMGSRRERPSRRACTGQWADTGIRSLAQVSLPAHDLSAMDGYAVRCGLRAWHPADAYWQSAAGHPGGRHWPRADCQDFTGAIVPAGADAILLQEDADATAEIDSATVMPAKRLHPAPISGRPVSM